MTTRHACECTAHPDACPRHGTLRDGWYICARCVRHWRKP
jgi:hypothetical protein